jgi:hypothetical protein
MYNKIASSFNLDVVAAVLSVVDNVDSLLFVEVTILARFTA